MQLSWNKLILSYIERRLFDLFIMEFFLFNGIYADLILLEGRETITEKHLFCNFQEIKAIYRSRLSNQITFHEVKKNSHDSL